MAEQNGHVRRWFRQMRTADHLLDAQGLFALQSVTDAAWVNQTLRQVEHDATIDGFGMWNVTAPAHPLGHETRLYGMVLFSKLGGAQKVVAYDKALAQIRRDMEAASLEMQRKAARWKYGAMMDAVL